MKEKKISLIIIILFFILCIVLVVFAKLNIKHLDYKEYIGSSLYYSLPEEEFSSMYEFEKLSIHNSITDIENLVPTTEAILIITVQDLPDFLGDGIINNCKIEYVISGDNLKKGETIKIYDFIAWWKMSDTAYLGGSTPLKQNEKYMVFLNKAPSPNKKDTYIYSSIPYGHIQLDRSIEILINDNSFPLTIGDAMNYQFIFPTSTDQNLVDLYKENCNKLIEDFTNIQ